MDLKITKIGYYRLTGIMCEQDLKDLRHIMYAAIEDFEENCLTVEQRAVALRFMDLMDKQKDMPK